MELRFAAALAAGFFTAGSASAAIIYDNGGPNQTNLYFGDSSYVYTEAAENFTLAAGANTIGDVHWWGGCAYSTCPTGAFTLNFYNNASGLPSSLISSYNVGSAHQTLTGNAISLVLIPEYSYSANIPALTLAAGTPYWLGISDSATTDVTWGWETTSTVHDSAHAQFCNDPDTCASGGGWESEPNDVAFNLTSREVSAVPEPGTLTLLGMGLAGFCAL